MRERIKIAGLREPNWLSPGECVRLSGKVNGIECSVIPDTGAEIIVVPGNLVPDCLNMKLYSYGAIGEPVRAQCAIVNLELEGRQFSRRVVVATKDLPTDEVLFPIPLTKESAKQMLLGAALREEAREVGHSGDAPDTQGGATTVVEPPQLKDQHCMAVTRCQQRQIVREKAISEERALVESGIIGTEESSPKVDSSEGLGQQFATNQNVKGGECVSSPVPEGNVTSADAGVACKSTPPAGMDSSRVVSGTPTAGAGACDNLTVKPKGKCRVA